VERIKEHGRAARCRLHKRNPHTVHAGTPPRRRQDGRLRAVADQRGDANCAVQERSESLTAAGDGKDGQMGGAAECVLLFLGEGRPVARVKRSWPPEASR
jgi:hypothetical protein